MVESKVTLPTSEGPMDMHCFVPDGATPARLPAVIVLQEAFGVNPHIKRLCRRVAGAGYAAFAPELFHRTGRGLEFGYDEFPRIRPIIGQLTNDRIYEDLEAAHRHASLLPNVDPARIATWGFCMGGWASVLAASGLPIAAAISFCSLRSSWISWRSIRNSASQWSSPGPEVTCLPSTEGRSGRRLAIPERGTARSGCRSDRTANPRSPSPRTGPRSSRRRSSRPGGARRRTT